MRRILYLAIVILALTLVNASPTRGQEPAPRFEPSECPIKVPSDVNVDCGTLIAPEDYHHPEGRQVRLPVLIIRNQEASASKQALLFTEGGPGYSSLASVWWLSKTPFVEGRDVVILEQRGNIHAEPSLKCDISIWWDESDGSTPCLDGLRGQGIDLTNYNSETIAEDIHSLKTALGYEEWILYGTSYSTRLMQLVMQSYPDKIRSVVLHSILPITESRFEHDPEHSVRALEVMLDDCAADPECSSAYPELESQLYELVRKLNADPVELKMTLPQINQEIDYEVDGYKVIGWMVGNAFYRPAHPPYPTAYLPLLIDRLSRGDWDLVYPWARAGLERYGDPNFAWGLYLAVNCQDEAPLVNRGMLAAQAAAHPELEGYLRHGDELTICEDWDLTPGPPLANTPIRSELPTLALGGSYDPITPPTWSRTAITGLSNATFIEFPAAGHSVLTDNPCAVNIISDFLNNPDQQPDTGCLAETPDPRYVLPREMILAPDVYEIHYGEIGFSELEQDLFLGSLVALGAAAVLVFILGVVRRMRHMEGNSPDRLARLAQPALAMLGLVAWLWSYALRAALRETASVAPIALRFGLPVDYWWLFVVALLIGFMTVGLLLIMGLAWRREYWSAPVRLLFSVGTTAAGLFSGMLASWGLLTALFV